MLPWQELLLVSESDDEPPLWDDLALLRDGEPSALTCAALRARAGRVHPLEAVAPPLDVYHMDGECSNCFAFHLLKGY